MAIGGVSVFPVSFASGVSLSTALDLGRGYSKVHFDPTGAAGQTQFYAAYESSGTYRLVKFPVLSGTVAPGTFMVGSAVSGSLTEVTALQGLRYVKVGITGAVADGVTLRLYCSDV